MSCDRTRSIAVILILLALIAYADAYPTDGHTGFDGMDWPSFIAYTGEQFTGAMAQHQFAQMVGAPGQLHPESLPRSTQGSQSTPPMAENGQHLMPNRLPPRSYLPTQAPTVVDDHFGIIGPWGMELPDNLTMGLGIQYTHGDASRRASENGTEPIVRQGLVGGHDPLSDSIGYMPTRQSTLPQRPDLSSVTSAPRSMASQTPGNFGVIGTPANTSFMEQPFMAQQPGSQTWPLDPLSMQSLPIDDFSLQQYPMLPDGQQSIMPAMPACSAYQYGATMVQTPEILSSDITNNYNFQHDMIPNNVSMLGWINRAPTTGDRALPRLNTDQSLDPNRLVPPESTSATRSPTSASTTGSSGGRPGSRRRQAWPAAAAASGNIHCHYCHAPCTTQGELTHHMRSHAPYMSRQHVCPHCDKRFQYRKDLARHLPKHDPNRPRFHCPIGNCKYHARGFGRQDHLDRHMGSQHRVEPPREDTPQRARTPSR